jgi:hypothetical protein
LNNVTSYLMTLIIDVMYVLNLNSMINHYISTKNDSEQRLFISLYYYVDKAYDIFVLL